ncbi:MAG: flagellar M-ring protein FliF [Planctomycetaceae bacterium]|nr:flagellar M-ring protein FliF [Planctomycetaceae bacterium]
MSTPQINKLLSIWNGWSFNEKLQFGTAAMVCVLAIGGVVYWSSQPDYVLLADRLGPVVAHEAVSALEAQNISYKLSFSGTSISVPKSDIARGRIALRDVLPTEGAVDEGGGMSDFWADPASIEARKNRELETRLARSIGQFRSVRSATVHITRPKASPFVRGATPTKASVVLELQSGGVEQSLDVRAVVALVAHSVEELEPENVTIVDTNGQLLSAEGSIEANVGSQIEFRNRLESGLAAKAQGMLTSLLGPNKAMVRVTADLDFTETERNQVTFDPDMKVKSSETIRTEQSTNSSGGASGAAGSGSNIGRALAASTGNGISKSEDIDTKYENAKTVDVIREAPGKIKRLTVAAVVELPEADGSGAAPAITQAQIEGIIKQAVGFDDARKDKIEVLTGKLQSYADVLPAPTMMDQLLQAEPLIRAASLGMASLFALLLGLILVRRLKPVVIASGPETEQVVGLQSKLERLQTEIRNDPERVAELMAEWLDERGEQYGGDTANSRAA